MPNDSRDPHRFPKHPRFDQEGNEGFECAQAASALARQTPPDGLSLQDLLDEGLRGEAGSGPFPALTGKDLLDATAARQLGAARRPEAGERLAAFRRGKAHAFRVPCRAAEEPACSTAWCGVALLADNWVVKSADEVEEGQLCSRCFAKGSDDATSVCSSSTSSASSAP